MPLTDDLEGFVATKPGPRCGIYKVERDLDADGLAVLHKHVNGNAPLAAVSRWLKSHGYSVSALTVGRHRGGLCSCSQTT